MASAISIEDVSKSYRLYDERNQSLKAWVVRGKRQRYAELAALADVSFEIEAGTTFGLIGHNGCGKSTLLKCIAGILHPEQGTIRVDGKISALIELGAGFHPELSGRDNVFLNGTLLGLSTRQVEQRFDEIVEFSELEDAIDRPVKNYSSGMYMRLGFSIAINVDPEILLVDEVLAVGDESFQRKCMDKFAQLRADGRTVVIVSHALDTMRLLCDRAAYLDHGKLLGVGPAGDMIDLYLGHDGTTVTRPSADHARWGSGEALITSVDILDEHGRPLSAVRRGDRITARVHYLTHEHVASPQLGLSLHTAEGITVAVSPSGAPLGPLDGAGHVDALLDPLPLQPGAYGLTAYLQDLHRQHAYDVRYRFLTFTVEPGGVEEGGGVLSIGAQWKDPVPTTA